MEKQERSKQKRKEYHAMYYVKNKTKILEQSKKWHQDHPEKTKQSCATYKEKHPEKYNATQKKSWKKWYEKNKELVRLANNKWKEDNIQKVKDYHREYVAKKRRDETHRLNSNISRAINHSLCGSKSGRHWESLVGYTSDQLKRHLEKQFLVGMTWENYGQWHVDHRIPISAFNFEKPEDIDFKQCWSLRNLRPLWAVDNIRKLNKLEKPFQPSLAMAV